MSISNSLFLDTAASRQELRDALVQADIGLSSDPDFTSTSGLTSSEAISASTSVTIIDDLSGRCGRLDNGVIPNRHVIFDFRKKDWYEYDMQTVRGIVALLKAFPDADAFWVAYDAEVPILLRRDGRLVLAQQQTEPRHLWDPARDPSYIAMVDLPYTIAPLGPWDFIETSPSDPQREPAAR